MIKQTNVILLWLRSVNHRCGEQYRCIKAISHLLPFAIGYGEYQHGCGHPRRSALYRRRGRARVQYYSAPPPPLIVHDYVFIHLLMFFIYLVVVC